MINKLLFAYNVSLTDNVELMMTLLFAYNVSDKITLLPTDNVDNIVSLDTDNESFICKLCWI